MTPEQLLTAFSDAPTSLGVLLIHLALGLVLSLLLQWHFVRYGSTLSNRSSFARTFPFLVLTTILIISVIKSSLALSLGLVGALSIVRFRTPIKEPEELAYLFVAIAIGLGLGATQTLVTVVATLVILGVMAILNRTGREEGKNLYLSVATASTAPGAELEALAEVLGAHAVSVDLRRFDVRDGALDATYYVDVAGTDKLSALVAAVQERFPEAGVSFVDQNRLPSV